MGPLGHAWLEWLEALRLRAGRGPVASVAAKVAADTIVFGPVHVAGFLTVPSLAKGESLEACRCHLETLFWPTLIAESVAWACVQAVNFACVPVRHQLAVINLVTLLDAAALSWWKEGGAASLMLEAPKR